MDESDQGSGDKSGVRIARSFFLFLSCSSRDSSDCECPVSTSPTDRFRGCRRPGIAPYRSVDSLHSCPSRLHSMTLSARSRIELGILMPSALAVSNILPIPQQPSRRSAHDDIRPFRGFFVHKRVELPAGGVSALQRPFDPPPLTSICHSIRVSGRWIARFLQNGTGAQTRAAASRLRARQCCAERRRLPLSQAARERCLRARLPARLLRQAARLLLALSAEARAFMRQALRAAAANPVHYERRRPEETTLYRLVQENLETFLAEVEAGGMANLPQFVKDEFDAFLECGILAHGFLRVR